MDPRDPMDPSLLIQGDGENEWLPPLEWQQRLILETYRTWVSCCGQGGSPTPTVGSRQVWAQGFWYQAVVNGDGSFLENVTLGTTRRIHFLPQHSGRRVAP